MHEALIELRNFRIEDSLGLTSSMHLLALHNYGSVLTLKDRRTDLSQLTQTPLTQPPSS